MKSRYPRSTRGASAIGWNAAAKATVGPSSYRREGERRHDAKVASAAADCPEEVGVRVGRGRPYLPPGVDDLRGDKAVARQPVLAAHPPFTTSERKSRDPGVRNDTARRGQPEDLGFAVDIAPQGTALRSDELRIGIDVDPVHEGEIEQHPSVDARQARDGMSSAADREQQALFAGELDRVDDVGGAGGLHHHGRAIAVHRVVDRTDGVIPRITRR